MAASGLQQLFPERAALVHSLFPPFGAVRNGNKGDSCALEVPEGFDGVVDGHLGEQAGPGIENM